MASFSKNKKGKWQVSFYCKNGYGKNKKYKKGNFDTKKEAIKYVENFKNLNENTKNALFSDILLDYFEKNKENWKLRTQRGTHSRIKNVLSSDLATKKINDIKARDLQNFLGDKTESNKRVYLSFIRRVFKYAFIYYDIVNNPTLKIELKPIKKRKEQTLYSVEDFKKLDEALKKEKAEDTRLYFNLLFYSEARAGEVAGLTVDDVDFKNKKIDINKTRITKNFSNSPKNSSSYRKIEINTKVLKLLDEYIKSIPKVKGLYLFSTPLTYRNRLIKIIKKYDLKPIKLHGFRHSHASILINKNVPITAISKRLGHSNSNTTLKVYLHYLKDENNKISDILERL